MMNILLVTHYFSTHRGGVEQVAAQLAERLAQDGQFHIEWVASDCDPPPETASRVFMHPLRSWNGLERLGFPWPVWTWRALSELKEAVKRADAVHLHDFIYFGNIAAFFFARRLRKPVIITQHIGDAPYRNRLLAVTLKLINRTLGRYMLSKARQVVFISDEVRRQFASHTPFGHAPIFWPNGVDTGIFYPLPDAERATLRHRMGAHDAQPVFLFVGRFIGMKGLTLLRQLAEAMPEARWWFAGWGPGRSFLHPANWALPNVTIFGDRTGATLADCYRAADLLLLPSQSEGFPLVVQEAMACGTPALVSAEAAIGAPDAQDKLYICDVEPRSSACARWQDTLRGIMLSQSLQQRKESISGFARREWSWDICVARYAALFRSL